MRVITQCAVADETLTGRGSASLPFSNAHRLRESTGAKAVALINPEQPVGKVVWQPEPFTLTHSFAALGAA